MRSCSLARTSSTVMSSPVPCSESTSSSPVICVRQLPSPCSARSHVTLTLAPATPMPTPVTLRSLCCATSSRAAARERSRISSSIPGTAVIFATTHPLAAAISAANARRAVFPVPRAPEMSVVSSGRRVAESNDFRRSLMTCCRPAMIAGTSPKEGVKGFSNISAIAIAPLDDAVATSLF